MQARLQAFEQLNKFAFKSAPQALPKAAPKAVPFPSDLESQLQKLSLKVKHLQERPAPEVPKDELDRVMAGLLKEMRIEMNFERLKFESGFKIQLESQAENIKVLEQSLNRLYLTIVKREEVRIHDSYSTMATSLVRDINAPSIMQSLQQQKFRSETQAILD